MNTPSLDMPTFLSFVTWHETRASLASFARWNVLNLSWQWRLHFWSADATHTGRRACTRNKGTSFSRRRATPCFFFARATRWRIRACDMGNRDTWHRLFARTRDKHEKIYIWRKPPIARHVINGTNPTVTRTVPTSVTFHVQIVPPTASRWSIYKYAYCFSFMIKILRYACQKRSRVFRWIYGAPRKWINWIGIKERRRMKDKENDWNVCKRWLNK